MGDEDRRNATSKPKTGARERRERLSQDEDHEKVDRDSANSFPTSDPPSTSNPGNGTEEGWNR